MTADQIPDLPRRRPRYSRSVMEDAWRVAWEYLGQPDIEVSRADLIDIMQRSTTVSYRTAREILIAAVGNGSLLVAARDASGHPTLKRPA
jgi:hypothetical protein